MHRNMKELHSNNASKSHHHGFLLENNKVVIVESFSRVTNARLASLRVLQNV